MHAARASERAIAEALRGALFPSKVAGRMDRCGSRGGRPALAEEVEPHDIRGAEGAPVPGGALQRANVAPRKTRNNLVHDVAWQVASFHVPRPWIGLEFLARVQLRHCYSSTLPNSQGTHELVKTQMLRPSLRFPSRPSAPSLTIVHCSGRLYSKLTLSATQTHCTLTTEPFALRHAFTYLSRCVQQLRESLLLVPNCSKVFSFPPPPPRPGRFRISDPR